jgi:hypothetical protein
MINASARVNPKFGRTDLPPELIKWITVTAKSGSEDLGDDARWVSTDELESADFVLIPHRYVSITSEQFGHFDVSASQAELTEWEEKTRVAASRMDSILNELETL